FPKTFLTPGATARVHGCGSRGFVTPAALRKPCASLPAAARSTFLHWPRGSVLSLSVPRRSEIATPLSHIQSHHQRAILAIFMSRGVKGNDRPPSINDLARFDRGGGSRAGRTASSPDPWKFAFSRGLSQAARRRSLQEVSPCCVRSA